MSAYTLKQQDAILKSIANDPIMPMQEKQTALAEATRFFSEDGFDVNPDLSDLSDVLGEWKEIPLTVVGHAEVLGFHRN